jgi:predicted hydrocarbon binding protein
MQNKMTKCKTCKTKLNKKWDYCPQCGGKTKEEQFEVKIDKIRYLVERQKGGDIIYDNFKSAMQVSRFHFGKQKVMRETLGDFVNINFGALRIFSMLCQKPEYINEFFKVGKLLGYFATIEGLKQLNKERNVGLPYKSDIFWKFLSDERIQEYHKKEWYLTKEGLLQFVEANKKEEVIRYHLKESPMSVFKCNKPLCFFELASECGIAEALSNAYWTGRETMCESKGDEHCEFEIVLEKQYSELAIKEFSKEGLEDLLNQCIENIISGDKRRRNRLGNTIYIMDDQIINYLLISPSIGHNILSKYSGCFVGEQIIEKSDINGWEEALDYLIQLFEYMKIGLLQIESKTSDKIGLRMEESVYSSGVKNINMRLDTFIVGIIEGALKQSTGQKWLVEETKCIAHGNDYCEFTCKTK